MILKFYLFIFYKWSDEMKWYIIVFFLALGFPLLLEKTHTNQDPSTQIYCYGYQTTFAIWYSYSNKVVKNNMLALDVAIFIKVLEIWDLSILHAICF